MKRYMLCLLFCACLLCSGLGAASATPLKAVTESWAPYFGPELENKGVVVELANEIFKRAGYEINVEFIPWTRAVELVKRGDADLLVGAYYTDKRAKAMAYPENVLVTSNVLFAKKDKGISFSTMEDLKNYTIGVQKGAAYGDEFDKATFLKKDAATDRLAGIKKLMADRVDLMAGPKDVVLYEMKKQFPGKADQVEALSPPLSENKVYICVSKKHPNYQTVVDQFNAKLAEIKADGTYDAIMKKHGFSAN
ncbi:transporter substrate-binding domain-containing protein [Salidesulfovibrio brasiliensis]